MQLRSLLEKFNPGLAIDAELAALESGADLAQDSPPGVEDGAAREDYEWNEASSNASPNGGNVSSAAQKDGMAILPSINSGYLGRSSGSEILQEITHLDASLRGGNYQDRSRERTSAEDKIALERHRQLFWVVYCFDSGFSITTGRPMAVLEGFIDQALPRNIDDRDCDNSSVVPTPVNYPTTYSALIAQAQLAKIANGIHHEFLCAKTANQKMEYQLAEIMAQKLDAWRDSLPDYFTSSDVPAWFMGPRSIVLWKEQNLRILLWRGTKKVHPYLPSRMDARGRCLDAAMETIQSISSFVTSSETTLHPGISWYATYFIFQAILVLEASCLGRSVQPDQDFPCDSSGWETSVSAATQCLERLAQRSNSAALCLEFIERIHRSAGEVPMNSAAQQQATDGVLAFDYLFDPTVWTSEMDNIATDPVLRDLIGEAFLDFDAVLTAPCGSD
ncbi:hypothetical protein CEP51_004255 [Fusarium floridanum]|nr:hypothetical protein CEP51_004255 [Fusarium floridanum]RSM14155.1 hypothetical protein CDV31_005491 [Fusarium ambrosium]